MAWGFKKDEELVPELKGKTQQQVVDELKAAEAVRLEKIAADAKAAKLQTDLDAINSEFNKTKERVAALEKNPPKAGNEPPPAETPSVLTDEDAAFAARQAPLTTAVLINAARTARILASQQAERDPALAYVLKKYGAEVESFYNSIPLSSRGSELAFLNCIKLVQSNHFSEILDAAKKDNGALFSESAGGPRPPEQKNQDGDKLSPDEQAVARKMRLTDEEYLKSKKSLNLVGV